MKSFLQDLVAHTTPLDLTIVKVSPINNQTVIEGRSDDKSILMTAKTHNPIKEFDAVFGMPNLNRLGAILKCSEYSEKEKISIVLAERNEVQVPTGLHFENETGDYQNDYRFMSTNVINDRIKELKSKTEIKWDISFVPSLPSIKRFQFQSSALSEETLFRASTKGSNLIFELGDENTHAGSFVFAENVNGKMAAARYWPIKQTLSILNLVGDTTINISNQSAMKITVDSGLVVYDFILPAHSK